MLCIFPIIRAETGLGCPLIDLAIMPKARPFAPAQVRFGEGVRYVRCNTSKPVTAATGHE